MPKMTPESKAGLEPQAEPRIVEAVGSAATVGGAATGKRQGPSLSQRIEKAMGDAILKAYADGITDPERQRALKLEARDRVRAEYAAEQQRAAVEAQRQGAIKSEPK